MLEEAFKLFLINYCLTVGKDKKLRDVYFIAKKKFTATNRKCDYGFDMLVNKKKMTRY
jgi:hypothetical protein